MVEFINRLGQNVKDFAQSTAKTIGSEYDKISSSVKESIEDFTTPETIGKARRAKNIPKDGEPSKANTASAVYSEPPETKDWRVRLGLPNNSIFKDSNLLKPLIETNGLIFPFQPTIIYQGMANYGANRLTHTNYPYHYYENTDISPIQIVGDFYVQNQDDARYWVAAIHYLKSVTKMAYGQSSNNGTPPPIIKLNGYGDYIFNNVPVVVESFMFELGADVDYISTALMVESNDEQSAISWAPTRSQITVTVKPIYSRRQTEQFSLDAFVKGDYVKNRKGFL